MTNVTTVYHGLQVIHEDAENQLKVLLKYLEFNWTIKYFLMLYWTKTI